MSKLIPLILFCGIAICWTLIYTIMIRRGFKDKTYSMPIPPFCLNLSWEFLFSFIFIQTPVQMFVYILWFIQDLIIFYQILRYGKENLQQAIIKRFFYPLILFSIVLGFFAVLTFRLDFGEGNVTYLTVGQHIMMTVLLTVMLFNRGIKGQSLYIAILMMFSTVITTGFLFLHPRNSLFLYYLYITMFILDWTYIVLLYTRLKKEGINPWKRI